MSLRRCVLRTAVGSPSLQQTANFAFVSPEFFSSAVWLKTAEFAYSPCRFREIFPTDHSNTEYPETDEESDDFF